MFAVTQCSNQRNEFSPVAFLFHWIWGTGTELFLLDRYRWDISRWSSSVLIHSQNRRNNHQASSVKMKATVERNALPVPEPLESGMLFYIFPSVILINWAFHPFQAAAGSWQTHLARKKTDSMIPDNWRLDQRRWRSDDDGKILGVILRSIISACRRPQQAKKMFSALLEA